MNARKALDIVDDEIRVFTLGAISAWLWGTSVALTLKVETFPTIYRSDRRYWA